MNNEQVAAVGFLLSTYESDLNYFANFVRLSNGEISPDNYCLKAEGTFKNFIDEYRVARNTKRDLTPALLNCALEWHQKGQTKDVDGFTLVIRDKGLTHGKMATSLASKIMYLMNPWDVLPLDRLAKIGVQYKGSNYVGFISEVEQFRQKHQVEIRQSLERIAGMLDIIESQYAGQIRDLEKIRENRFVDKWLWVKGGNK